MAGTTLNGLSIAPPEPWMDQAVCASVLDDEIFYPPKGKSTTRAKKICKGCPVVAECLTYALTHREQYGVWGGASERERRRMRVSYPCLKCSAVLLSRHGLLMHARSHLAAA